MSTDPTTPTTEGPKPPPETLCVGGCGQFATQFSADGLPYCADADEEELKGRGSCVPAGEVLPFGREVHDDEW